MSDDDLVVDRLIRDRDEQWHQIRFPFTDERVATLIATQLRHHLCFMPGVGWHSWEQLNPQAGLWSDRGAVARGAREIVADMIGDWVDAVDGDPTGWKTERMDAQARQYLTFGRINGVIAALEAKLAVDIAAFDASPHQINTPAGMYDLITRTVRPTEPADRCRKMSRLVWRDDWVDQILEQTAGGGSVIDAIADIGGESRFWKFLVDTFGSDDDLAVYVWRLMGACCVGDGPQELVHVVVGPGANGKSVLWNTMQWFLGGDGADSYAAVAPSDAIIQGSTNGGRGIHSLWSAVGCRMLFFPELPYGKIDQSILKALSSAEPLHINRKYVDEQIFRNPGKLIAHTNVEPRVSQSRDGGLWRRLRLVPHRHIVPEEQQDVRLAPGFGAADIDRELVGSMIMAAAARYADPALDKRLVMPTSVREATAAYRDSEDYLTRFVEENLLITGDRTWRAFTRDVFARYKQWCEAENLNPGTAQAFTRNLSAHPLVKDAEMGRVGSGGRYWVGVKLVEDTRTDRPGVVGYKDQGEF